MKRAAALLLASLILALVLSPAAPAQAAGMNTAGDMPVVSQRAADLRVGLRKLWDEHVALTSLYVTNAVSNLESTDAVAKRLLKNQDDLGNAIKPLYGDAAGKKLTALLREHIQIAVDVVKAAKTGDKDALAKAQKRWYANADDIAGFLSAANPNWPRDTVADMLYTHLKLTTDAATAALHKDWNGAIQAYDKGRDHMLLFSDVMTNGILKQFPEKFR